MSDLSDVLHRMVDMLPWRQEQDKLNAHDSLNSHFKASETVPQPETPNVDPNTQPTGSSNVSGTSSTSSGSSSASSSGSSGSSGSK